MIMTIRRLATALAFVAILSSGALAHGVLNFTVDLRNTASHEVHVTLVPSGFPAKSAFYQMPVWAPGAYSVTHYGRYVKNFRALDKAGHQLAVKQVNDDRWEIPAGRSLRTIEYDVTDSHDDSTSLYFAMANIDTSLFFANATALFGYFDDDKAAASKVRYELPVGWNLICALPPDRTGVYTETTTEDPGNLPIARSFDASDYDALADAPVLASLDTASENADRLLTTNFKEGSADYTVAVATDGDWSDARMDSLVEYLRKIVHAETDFFHDTPFKHYTFEIVAPTLSHMPSFAQGALEHAYSSDYLVMDASWPLFKQMFLTIFSHEFFHLWNVKRIHSVLLGPFDYTHRVKTRSLWLAEGVTEYYAHTLLARYGIITPKQLYSDIGEWRKEMAMAPPEANKKSLEQLSIDESSFEIDEATLFYSRGPLVALMLDIYIREHTDNKKSLDDVMLALNNDAKHGKTFKEQNLIHLIEKYSGVDLTDFYNRYIHGTDSLPIDTYLAKMGLTHGEGKSTVSFGFKDGKLVIASLDSGSIFARAGVEPGDALVAVNGTKLSFHNLDILMSLRDSQNSATLTVERDGKNLDIPVNFNADAGHSGDASVPPLALAIRKGIVGQ